MPKYVNKNNTSAQASTEVDIFKRIYDKLSRMTSADIENRVREIAKRKAEKDKK